MSRSASNLANSLRSWIVVKAFHRKSVTSPTQTMAPMRPRMIPAKSGGGGHSLSSLSGVRWRTIVLVGKLSVGGLYENV